MATGLVKVLPEATVTIYADDGEGNLLDEVPLFTDCLLIGVEINEALEIISRESTGRRRRKKHARTYDYSATISELYLSKVLQHDMDDIYHRAAKLQFWLSFFGETDAEETWKLKIAMFDSFRLTGDDNDVLRYTATVTAEDIDRGI